MRADGLDDFFPGGVWIGLQEYLGPHEETGSTETALHGSPVTLLMGVEQARHALPFSSTRQAPQAA